MPSPRSPRSPRRTATRSPESRAGTPDLFDLSRLEFGAVGDNPWCDVLPDDVPEGTPPLHTSPPPRERRTRTPKRERRTRTPKRERRTRTPEKQTAPLSSPEFLMQRDTLHELYQQLHREERINDDEIKSNAKCERILNRRVRWNPDGTALEPEAFKALISKIKDKYPKTGSAKKRKRTRRRKRRKKPKRIKKKKGKSKKR